MKISSFSPWEIVDAKVMARDGHDFTAINGLKMIENGDEQRRPFSAVAGGRMPCYRRRHQPVRDRKLTP
jgi:hypothetical protein